MDVGQWVYKNWDEVGGIAFLPKEDDSHSYVQAPYEEIDKNKYEELALALPDIEYGNYMEFDDNTTSSQELACTAGVCEI